MNFKKLNIIIGSIYAILFIIGIILLINQKRIVDGVLSGKIININENKVEVECISSKCTKYGDKVGYTFELPKYKKYKIGDFINFKVIDGKAVYSFFNEDSSVKISIALINGPFISMFYILLSHLFDKKRYLDIICGTIPLLIIPAAFINDTAFIYSFVATAIPFLITIIVALIESHKEVRNNERF